MTGEPTPAGHVRIALRWRDMDMLGHLNQAVYHELLEEGRGELLTGLSPDGRGFPWVLARVELDYRHEVRRDAGHVDVHSRVERVGGKSVTLTHEILLPDGTLAASGRSILVAWDPHARSSREFTADERSALTT